MLHLSRLTSLALTIALVIGAPLAFAAQPAPAVAPAGTAATSKAPLPLEELRTFAEVMDRIKAAYVEPVDDKTLLENAIKGMLSNLDPRSAVINTEAGLYIESPELAERLVAYMATGVVPANSYRVLLAPNGGIVWETAREGQSVHYRDEPETRFRRRLGADLLKLLPIDSQL